MWKINSLESSLRERLVDIERAQGLQGELCYFRRSAAGQALRICLLAGLLVAVASLGLCDVVLRREESLLLKSFLVTLAALATVWTALLLIEGLRALFSRIKPFVLITPKVLIQSDYEHGFLTAYRLSDATDFKSVDCYSGTEFKARMFTFTFPEGKTSVLKATDQAAIGRIQEVLAQARAGDARDGGGTRGLELLPDGPGRGSAGLRSITNPLAEFWWGIGGLLLIGLLVVVVFERS